MPSPYGSWKSPIGAEQIVSRSIGLSKPLAAGQKSDGILWAESRPTEGGRTVIVERRTDGSVIDRSPAGYNVRSRVHEYGGGAWTASGATLWFVNDHDQCIYQQQGDQPPQAIVAASDCNYGDLHPSPCGTQLIAVQEQAGSDGDETTDRLVSITLADGDHDCSVTVLAEGEDFYSSPCMSADGRRLAWLSWNHPGMPWDGSRLWLADILSNGTVANTSVIAGSEHESIFQPQWADNGDLYFVSDRSSWWNLYRWDGREVSALLPMQAEFGLPQWVFGMSTYGIASDGRLVCAFTESGRWRLGVLDPANADWQVLELPYTTFSDVSVSGQSALMLAGSPQRATAIISVDLSTIDNTAHPDQQLVSTIQSSDDSAPDPTYLSQPHYIDYPGSRGETAHALYYPPCNADFSAPADELPPLLVRSHGGPTAATSSTLNPSIQFWTSRGFAVLDVNYGGSTGYGRDYRQRLDGRWGETDVDDCVCGADYLIEQGLADPQRCAIRGSSAGGYTTLAALTFRDRFRAGASLYGISDLEALITDTHKFESRYLERLIGPYPEQRETYRQRSPVHFTDQLSCPIIFFQGLQDKVVPPNQAEAMVAALRSKGLPVAYLSFPDEQHGFRAATTIKTALEAELYFYARIFGFEPADVLPAIIIDNL